MIDFPTVYKWLNFFDKSSLDDAAKLLVNRFLNSSDKGSESDQDAEAVEAVAKVSRDPMCTAEVLVVLSEALFRKGRFKLAWRKLNEAVKIYEAQVGKVKTNTTRHRLAVTRLLCGFCAWKLFAHYSAIDAWKYAREDFSKLLEDSEDQKLGDRASWYKDIIFKLDVALACTAEEPYTWVYKYPDNNFEVRTTAKHEKPQSVINDGDQTRTLSGSKVTRLGSDLFWRRNRIVEEIKRAEQVMLNSDVDTVGDFRIPHQMIQAMLDSLDRRYDLSERAEALLECALGLHQMRDNRTAAFTLGRAIPYFAPKSHQQVIARWMLGILQLQPGSDYPDALDTLRIAREDLSILKHRGNDDNNKELVQWYDEKLCIMDAALSEILDRMNSLH